MAEQEAEETVHDRSRARSGSAGPWRIVGHVAVTSVVLVVLHTLMAIVAYLVARPTANITAFAVLQGVLGLLVVLFAMRWRTAAGLRHGVTAVPWSLGAGLLGYLLLPASWAGGALLSWQLVGRGPVSWLIDLLLWGAAVGLGVLWGGSRVSLPEQPSTPYG